MWQRGPWGYLSLGLLPRKAVGDDTKCQLIQIYNIDPSMKTSTWPGQQRWDLQVKPGGQS